MDTRQYILFGILQHLYIQAEKTSSEQDLSEFLAISENAVRDGLMDLEKKGLVRGIRLTMSGLAAASAISAARRARSPAAA